MGVVRVTVHVIMAAEGDPSSLAQALNSLAGVLSPLIQEIKSTAPPPTGVTTPAVGIHSPLPVTVHQSSAITTPISSATTHRYVYNVETLYPCKC